MRAARTAKEREDNARRAQELYELGRLEEAAELGNDAAKRALRKVDMPLTLREFKLKKGERDVMDLLSSTWKTNHGLNSMKVEFNVVSESTMSKTKELENLTARIERMRMDLRAPPLNGQSTATSAAAGGTPGLAPPSNDMLLGRRRAQGRRRGDLVSSTTDATFGSSDSSAFASSSSSSSAAVSSQKEGEKKTTVDKAPSAMTATERVNLELSQEVDSLTEQCKSCGRSFPRGRFAQHRSHCVAAARRRRKRTEQLGLMESPACLSSCTICGYFFQNKDMDAHYRSCLRSKISDKALVDSLLPKEPPVVPRPPTHLECVSVTAQSIDLRWRPPLFRGFMPLMDHHVEVQRLETEPPSDEISMRRRQMAAERAKRDRAKREKDEEAQRMEREKREADRRERFLAKAGEKDHRRRDNASQGGEKGLEGGRRSGVSFSAQPQVPSDQIVEYNREAVEPTTTKKEKWTIKTSSWLRLHPLATTGYSVTYLSADTKYKFRVRSVSTAGASLYSEWIEAKTATATAPTSCLFLEQDREVTLTDDTTSFALRWTCPEMDGGSDIVDYEISFELSVIKAKVTDVKSGMRENRRVRIRSGFIQAANMSVDESDKRTRFGDKYRGMRWCREVRYIVRGLEGGLTYRKIEVRAVNRAGFLSKTSQSRIAAISLRSPPRNEELLKDYRRALEEEKEALELGIFKSSEAFGGHFFDSSFFITGSFQRFPRRTAIVKIEEELLRMGEGPRARGIKMEVRGYEDGFGESGSDIDMSESDDEESEDDEPNDEPEAADGLRAQIEKGRRRRLKEEARTLRRRGSIGYGTNERYYRRVLARERLAGTELGRGTGSDGAPPHQQQEEEGENSRGNINDDDGARRRIRKEGTDIKHGTSNVLVLEEERAAEDLELFNVKCEQFRHKMHQLRRIAQHCQRIATDLHDKQMGFIPEIRRKESKARALEVELNRVRAFRGPRLDSDSLTNAPQRFRKEDLVASLNDTIEELSESVQTMKSDLVRCTQDSQAVLGAAVRAWKKYEERLAAFFNFRADHARRTRQWPSDAQLLTRHLDHWMWITAGRVMHCRSLKILFRWLFRLVGGRAFRKFKVQCGVSALRKNSSPEKNKESGGEKASSKCTVEHAFDPNAKKLPFEGRGDAMLRSMDNARTSLLNEMRYAVARTAHFNAAQRHIDHSSSHSAGAATFFLSAKHRALPVALESTSSSSSSSSGANGHEGVDLTGTGAGKRRKDKGRNNNKIDGSEEAASNPKEELEHALDKCGAKDPKHSAHRLFVENHVSWSDISWAFHSGGVEALKRLLLEANLETGTIGKIVSFFMQNRFGDGKNSNASAIGSKPKGFGGDDDDDDDDDDFDDEVYDSNGLMKMKRGAQKSKAKSSHGKRDRFSPSIEDVLAVPSEAKNVARKWMDDEEELGTFDLSLQKIVALLGNKQFVEADALCRRVHGACPPPVGLKASYEKTPSPRAAPEPLTEDEQNETLYLSLSQQAMVFLQQARAQVGMYESGVTERKRNQGHGVGAELEYALYCVDEAIDRAEAWRAVDEAPARQSASRSKGSNDDPKGSGWKQRRDLMTSRSLGGEEWSSDALLCWSLDAKGDVLSLLEAHSESIAAYVRSLDCLMALREAHAELGGRKSVSGASSSSSSSSSSVAANETGKSALEFRGGELEEANIAEKIAREYSRGESEEVKADQWRRRAEEVRNRRAGQRRRGKERLDRLHARMLDNAQADLASEVKLEECSNQVPALRLNRLAIIDAILDAEDALATAKESSGSALQQLQVAEEDLEKASKSEADTVESSAFGFATVYPVEAFRGLVAAHKSRLGEEHFETLKQQRAQEVLLKNLKEEQENIEDLLEVETGPLMARAAGSSRLIRALAANEANVLANDVTGKASGGVKLVASAVNCHVTCYDVQTGVMMAVLFGERLDARTPGGERPRGHASKITSLFLLRYRVYSGDHGGMIFVWDVMDGRNRREKRKSKKKDREKPDPGVGVFFAPTWAVDSADCVVDVLDEHDGAITAITADDEKLVTGSADCTIRIWDALEDSFECLFTLKGHTRSVTALQIVDFTFASGDATGQVRLWELVATQSHGGPPEDASSATPRVKFRRRGDDGGEGGQRDADRRYARVRLVMKIKHERSMDSPMHIAPKEMPTILDALQDSEQCFPVNGLSMIKGARQQQQQQQKAPFCENSQLTIRKFMQRDPPPAGRIRVHAISCLQYFGSEISCGDVHGKLFIWNIAQQRCVWDLQAHHGRVCCMQVDAVRVVTGGSDGRVRVFDIMTGTAIQTIQAHPIGSTVLALQFDALQLLTCGAEGGVKRWVWSLNARGGASSSSAGETRHFVASGETLKSIAGKYGTSIPTLLEWNKKRVKNAEDLYPGMSLVVAMAKPGESAEVELRTRQDQAQRKHSQHESAAMAEAAKREVQLQAKIRKHGERRRLRAMREPNDPPLPPAEDDHEDELVHPKYGLRVMESAVWKRRTKRKAAVGSSTATVSGATDTTTTG